MCTFHSCVNVLLSSQATWVSFCRTLSCCKAQPKLNQSAVIGDLGCNRDQGCYSIRWYALIACSQMSANGLVSQVRDSETTGKPPAMGCHIATSEE
jgi:hypothetical protein